MSGLEKTFPGKVTARNIDITTPGARDGFKGLGFRSHGLVVRSMDGRVLLAQPDHSVNIEEVETTLRQVLAPG